MRSFHNDLAIKEKYLSRVRQHRLADEIIQGIYWENGKGCAVGCTLHSSNHCAYENELGIPKLIARLEDAIFEKLPLERAKIWPEEFLDSIYIGSNLSEIWNKFAIWLLIDEVYGVLQYAKSDEQINCIKKIADYYSRFNQITKKEWTAVAEAAYVAEYADYAGSAWAAAYAAKAAYAAECAAYATKGVYSTYDDIYSNKRKKYAIAQADKLLELLREAK